MAEVIEDAVKPSVCCRN